MKDSKYYKKLKIKNKINYGSWMTKLLLSIIIVLICLIVTNFNDELRNVFEQEVLVDNMDFSDFNKLYKKFMVDDEQVELVSNVVDTTDMKEVNGRYRFNYGINYPVEVLKPGIIVFNGDKDELGRTVIVQGNDGVDIWYSGINLDDKSLYDYVSIGDILGSSIEPYLYVSIYEDGNLLKYEEYFE